MAHTQQSHSWHAFLPGTRVLDQVTGMDGVVQNSHVRHAVEAPASAAGELQAGRLLPLPKPVVHESVIVKLEDGTSVQRSPKVLVAI